MKALENKHVFITGANGGMGLETSKLLAQEKLASLTLAARTEEKAQFAKKEVQRVGSKIEVNAVFGFDMNKPEEIEKATDRLDSSRQFDIIFFQVGGVFFGNDYQYVNYNGMRIEKTLFQNTIGSYITLSNLRSKGLIAKNARVVFAGGEGARGIPGMIEKPVFTSTEEFENYSHGIGELKKYNMMNAIGVSKLASALLTQKLAQQEDGITYVWFTPGLTHGTNGLAKASPIQRFFMEKVMFGISGLLGFSQGPKKGAEKYLKALSGEYGINGDVLGSPEGKVLGKIVDQKPMNPSLTDQQLIDGFWNMLEEVYSLEKVA